MTPPLSSERNQPQRPKPTEYDDRDHVEEEDEEEVDLAFTEEELTRSFIRDIPQPEQQQPQQQQPPTQRAEMNEDDEFEEVDLAFTAQELTSSSTQRRNSFDFVVEEKKRDDANYDFLHGKKKAQSQPRPQHHQPQLAMPTKAMFGEGRGEFQGESVEMTDFSCSSRTRGSDLESGLFQEESTKKKEEEKKDGSGSDCGVM